MAGIYIHIPFCKQACSYCDFYFVTQKKLVEPFTKSLIQEIRSFRDSEFSVEPVETIYIGGGTPSQLSVDHLRKIFQALNETFRLDAGEVTMEMNPDDVTPEYLRSLLELGVNRASMGIQSFDENLLKFMHRAHSSREALQALEHLHTAGFPTFTADLIYGNPGQTTEMLEEDISRLLDFDPPHISAYSLTVEPKTRLGKQVELGRIDPPDDDKVSQHFDLLTDKLQANRISRYEVSNYSKPGKEAIHNSSYWKHENYLGLGPAAHSFWWSGNKARRWENKPDIKSYLDKESVSAKEKSELLDLGTLAEERLMLGLRTKWGVARKELAERYGYVLNRQQEEWLAYQKEKGMLMPDEDVLRLTPEGFKIADLLTVDLLSKG